MAADDSAGRKFLQTLVDRIAVQWDSEEIEIPAADFARILRRAVQGLPESKLRTELLAHLPVWQDDAWKRFNEKRRSTTPRAPKITTPADPNLFLASGRKQLLDKLASGKSGDKRADYERLARAVLEPTELAVAKEIFDQMQSISTPMEQVERILRFAVSQNSSLRTVLISPFRSAAEKLPPMQALQSCQRFLPLLTAAPASNSSADSLHSLAGFYLSLLSRAGVAEPSKLSTLRVLLPSLCWLRAAAAVAPPADPVPPTVLDFIFRLYSLALRALPAMPSTVEYLRACIVCNRGAALAVRTRRAADERELVRALEKAAVPLTIAPLIPSLASAQTNAAQIYSTLVTMPDDKLLSLLTLAEEAAAVAASEAQKADSKKPNAESDEEDEEEEEEEEEEEDEEEEKKKRPAQGDDALFFSDRSRSERIRTKVVRQENLAAAKKAQKEAKAKPAIANVDEDAEEAELHAAIASSAKKLASKSDVHKLALSGSEDDEPESVSRKGPAAVETEESEDDEEESERDEMGAAQATQEKSTTSQRNSKAQQSPRRKRREADVLQAELESLGISGGRNKAPRTSGRELRSTKRSAAK